MLLHDILTHSVNDNGGKRLAARCLSDTITYEELDNLSNKLSHCLINVGIKCGDRVCIYLDKSINSLIALFGILKAGAIYIPLDPGAPANRVGMIIKDSNSVAVLSVYSKAIKILDKLPNDGVLILFDNPEKIDYFNGTVILWESILKYNGFYTKPKIIESDPAYILYTSGSTGIPKGVVISHRASFVFIEWAYNEFKLLPGDIVSNHAPLNFDLSTFDIFATIMSGGTIILISPDVSLFPYNLASLISQSKINVWYSVPSMLVKMVLYGKLEQLDFSNLRLVLFAGEVFPIKYLQKLIEIIPHASFYNLYGPTETNVCTYYEVEKENLRDPLPIGKACPYNRLMVLKNGEIKDIENTQNNLDNNVIEGELCVEGQNVMSSYWGREPEDTKKVGKNIYCTGDWVKQDKDGNLNYSGRIDGMIKSRGYRIEIEEIESVLHKHQDVNRCAVVPVPDLENTNLIYAFIVLNNPVDENTGKPMLNEKTIKTFCSEYLPRYMVPAFVKFLLEMPETHNGKIDKLKLKELAIGR